jgi:hypothetical protein
MSGTPNDLQTEYDILSKDLAYVHAQWTLFQELFNPKSAEVMTTVTAFGWTMIHDAVVDSIILSLTRLLDPAQSGNRDNLTIPRLITISDPAKQVGLETKRKLATAQLEDLKTHRNKRIAHTDHRHKTKTEELPPLSHEKINNAMSAVVDLMREIRKQLSDGYTEYEPISEPTGSSIMLFLRAGVRVLALEREVKCGRITKDELYERVNKIIEPREPSLAPA